MSWQEALDAALDRAPGAGSVHVDGRDGARATIDVVQAGPIGVRLREVHVDHTEARDVATEARRLCADVRSLGRPILPIEVDPTLGGAILRTTPERQRWFDVTHTPQCTRVRRMHVGDDSTPTPVDFDLTREQLGDLLRALDGSG